MSLLRDFFVSVWHYFQLYESGAYYVQQDVVLLFFLLTMIKQLRQVQKNCRRVSIHAFYSTKVRKTRRQESNMRRNHNSFISSSRLWTCVSSYELLVSFCGRKEGENQRYTDSSRKNMLTIFGPTLIICMFCSRCVSLYPTGMFSQLNKLQLSEVTRSWRRQSST